MTYDYEITSSRTVVKDLGQKGYKLVRVYHESTQDRTLGTTYFIMEKEYD